MTWDRQGALAEAPVDGNLGRGFAALLLPYLAHQLFQGLHILCLAFGEQRPPCSFGIIAAIILACNMPS